MTGETEKALIGMRELATVATMETLGDASPPPARLKVNSHLHLPPNFSAFSTVKQAVDMAVAEKIGAVGVSNYYDYSVYGDFSRLARKGHVFPLYGLEIICLIENLQRQGIKINDPGNPGKLYICGKGITRFADAGEAALRMTPGAETILNTVRKNDSTRIGQMIQKLADLFSKNGFDTGLTESTVIDRVVARHECPRQRVYLQERHVCQAFQERFFELVPAPERQAKLSAVFGAPITTAPEDAVKIQNDIRSHLLKSGKPAYVPETFIGFDDAHRLIVELGGIICYPTLADGTIPICQFEDPVEKLIDKLKSWKIGFAEFIPIRNSPEVLTKYVKAMRGAGIVLTAGTEHNTLELLPIAPTCIGGKPIPDDLQSIFWEGACVVAAHQFLNLNGEKGFEAYCGEKRIQYLSKVGAAVIHKFQSRL